MAVEIERKFLMRSQSWRTQAYLQEDLRQAYLAITVLLTVRVRVVNGAQAWITIKSQSEGLARDEFEYAIPRADAERLVEARQGAVIEKVRHSIAFGGRT